MATWCETAVVVEQKVMETLSGGWPRPWFPLKGLHFMGSTVEPQAINMIYQQAKGGSGNGSLPSLTHGPVWNEWDVGWKRVCTAFPVLGYIC